MLEPRIAALLAGGSAQIVGTAGPDGAPHATRGWGIDLVADAEPGETVVRILLAADDAAARAHLVAGAWLAVTATDVPTLWSIQLKGRVRGVRGATTADRRRAEEHQDAMFDDIARTDGFPRELLHRFVPADYVVCELVVDELFDQTPGPGAGQRVPGAVA